MTPSTMSPVQQEIWSVFRSSDAWRGASDRSLAELIASSRVRCVPKGQRVFFAGDPSAHMAFVIRGHLRAVSTTAGGRRLTTATAWAGETLGLPLVIAEGIYPDDVEAGEQSVVAIVPAAALLDLMRKEPAVQAALLEVIARQSLELSRHLSSMSLDMPSRLANFVLERRAEAARRGRQIPTDLRVSRVELADLLGTAPETLSRTFAHFRAEGLIESDGGPIVTIVDEQRLTAIACGC